MVESLLSDIRFALRWLRKSPGFTVVAIASLAAGIGFNTALFTVVDALLFKPLPVSRPDRLVDVFTSAASGRAAQFSTTSYPDYLDLKSQNNVFDDVIGYTPMFGALGLETGSRLAMGEIVTGNYFRVLGVSALIGRTLGPEDDAPGAPRVAVVSYRYWTRELGSAPDVVGRTMRIRGNPLTIVGVLPRRFKGMVPVLSPELWIPVSASLDVEPVGLHDVVPSPSGANRLERRGDRWMFLRGRLRDGVTIDQARVNLSLVMSRLSAAYPATDRNREITLKATSDVHFHPMADPQILPIAGLLMGVVGLVLLIACANVASMLLARASGRQREIGVRLAIGASRGRLVQQLITESLVLSLLGAAAGGLLAWWITTVVAAIHLPTPIPLTFDLRMDGRVLAFTLAATALAGLVAGLAPALQATRPNLVAELRGEQTAGRAAGRAWTLRDGLVATQMAVTVVLLVVAALLMRSLLAAQRASLGFPASRLALVSFDASQLRYDRARTQLVFDRVVERLRGIAGVESAAVTTRPPFSINQNRWDIWFPGRQPLGQPGPTVEVTSVSPGYFETMSVPIVAGRAFTDADAADGPRVAIVNETMARRYWPGESAVGQTFRTRAGQGPLFEVVGVSADHKVSTVGEAPTPFLHVARRQQPNAYGAVIARTRGDAATLLRDMRREIHAVEPDLAFVENQTMESEVSTTLFPVRASAWLVSAVGGIAMLLAAVGLYGVVAYSVARRTREIGIRVALGAAPGSVVGLVMRQGLLVCAVGLASGGVLAAVLALVARRQLASLLYGVGLLDGVSWIGAAATLVAVSALANLVPAWRAARVDPSVALRIE
ncbi:MAG: ABC transporter permease [Acidobacteria bacterium]|nr:ABC transporter permease [Acidobacteriota bacterium]